MNPKEILEDPGISNCLKDATKTAYERDASEMPNIKGRAVERGGAFASKCGNTAAPPLRNRVSESTLRAVYLACCRWLRGRGLE
jgi:hypothetical protein